MRVRAGVCACPRRQVECCGSGPNCGPSRAPNTPAARSPRTRNPGERQPRAWQRASPFFCSDVLEHGVVEHCLGQKLLEPRVLVLERLQPLGVRHLEAAILRLPFVERRAADPVLAADVRGLRAGLLLPQNPDDLLFREPARLHVHPPAGDGLYPSLAEIAGLRSMRTRAPILSSLRRMVPQVTSGQTLILDDG